MTLVFVTYLFAWPAQHVMLKVNASSWDSAYTEAVDYCVQHVRDTNPALDNETLIDICVNPKETKVLK